MSDISGYAKLTVREIRAFTDHAPRFRALYDEASAKAHMESDMRASSRSWLSRLFRSSWDDIWEWDEIRDQYIPKWLRGDLLPNWAKRVRGMTDDTVILVDVDDVRMLRWIVESMTAKDADP